MRNTTQCVIHRDLRKIRGGKCQQLAVQTQMVQLFQRICNRGFKKSHRVEFKPLHPSCSIIDSSRSLYTCTVDMHSSPAEADKSFLLPLTSSILRAQESISEPDLEASPLTHKSTQSVRGRHLGKSLFLTRVSRKSRWVEVASNHRSLLGCLAIPLSHQPLFRSDLGSVT